MSIRFIHCADLHLGAVRKKNGENTSSSRFEMISFQKLIDTAIEENVDFVLFAGDVFDSFAIPVSVSLKFLEELGRLEENKIEFYIAAGNHDPYHLWPDFLKKQIGGSLFGSQESESKLFRSLKTGETCEIIGISHPHRQCDENLTDKMKIKYFDAQYRVACLHGQISSNSEHERYAPFQKEDLYRIPVDYWALGHIHKREIIQKNDPVILYPGNIQGRNFKESGFKGCYLVTFNPRSLTDFVFIPTSPVIYEEFTSDLTEIENLNVLKNRIIQSIKEQSSVFFESELRLKVILTGQTEFYKEIEELSESDDFLEDINDWTENGRIKIEQIENRTEPLLNFDDLKRGEDYLSSVYHLVRNWTEDPETIQVLFEDLLESMDDFYLKKIFQEEYNETLLKEFVQKAGIQLLSKLEKERNSVDY